MRIIIDTNIIIDYFEKREFFYEDAKKVFELISEDRFLSYITVKSLTDIFYVTRNYTYSNIATSK